MSDDMISTLAKQADRIATLQEALDAAMQTIKKGLGAVSSSYQQAQAEYQNHDIRAGRFGDDVRAWRTTAIAMLSAWETRHEEPKVTNGSTWDDQMRIIMRAENAEKALAEAQDAAPQPLMYPNAEWCEAYARWHAKHGPVASLRGDPQ